ncbi:ERF family protein [Caulobacter segnis]|uniref:ERF family protein n=1 Tax=Caulobacter segnis TaxID=88688 RepID=A0A2W5VID3_9CAUL|nr:ERF family protein [Caulobacter segnis]PZR36456.1 MAG: hypothetical protein DI526_03190 [Caulobacter segnis]
MSASAALDPNALEQFASGPARAPAPAARVRAGSVRPRLAVVKSDAPAILAAITAAALDPAVPVEKMEFMRRLYLEARTSAARSAYTVAMNAAQAAMAPIAANAVNSDFDSQYATYAALDRAMRPIYTAHGFTVGFTTEPSDLQRHQRVVIVLNHVDGHGETHRADFPADGLGDDGAPAQTLIHATASAFTYAQRYLLCLAFNIAVAKDSDGNIVAPPPEAITGGQYAELVFLLDSTATDEAEFARLLKVTNLAALPSHQFEHAKRLLQARKAA